MPVATRTLLACIAVLASHISPAHASDVQVVRISKSFTNVFAIVSDGRSVLVDAHNRGNHKWIARKLRKAGVPDPQLVILTHAHADHAGSAKRVAEAYGAPIWAGAGDVAMCEAGRNPRLKGAGLGFRILALTLPDGYPAFTPDKAVDEPTRLDPFGIAAEVRVAGGHTGGSLWIRLDDGRALTGDLIRSRMNRQHKPKRHFLHEDRNAANAHIDAIVADGVTELLPAHGGSLNRADVLTWIDEGRR